MQFLYIVTTGASDPTTASIPLHMAASGSLEAGQDVAVLFAGHGTEVVIGQNAEAMEGIGVPPMRELLAKLADHAVPVYV